MNPNFTQLPNDTKYLIFDFLSTRDILNFGTTCRANRQLINSPRIWIPRILKQFPGIKQEEIENLKHSKNILSEYVKMKRNIKIVENMNYYNLLRHVKNVHIQDNRREVASIRTFSFVICVCCISIFWLVGSILIPLHLDGFINNTNPWMWFLGYAFVLIAAAFIFFFSCIDLTVLRTKPLIWIYLVNSLKVLFFCNNYFEREDILFHAEDFSLKIQNITLWIPFAVIAAFIGQLLNILGFKVWRILSIPIIILMAIAICTLFDQARMAKYSDTKIERYFLAIAILVINFCLAVVIGLSCAKLDGALRVAWTIIFIPVHVIFVATVALNIIWRCFQRHDYGLPTTCKFTMLTTCNLILPTIFVIIFGLNLDKFINIPFIGVFAILWIVPFWSCICSCCN